MTAQGRPTLSAYLTLEADVHARRLAVVAQAGVRQHDEDVAGVGLDAVLGVARVADELPGGVDEGHASVIVPEPGDGGIRLEWLADGP